MEQQQLKDRLDRELEILMAYQSKNKLNAEKQRSKERHELEDRVRVRRNLLEKKVSPPVWAGRTGWRGELMGSAAVTDLLAAGMERSGTGSGCARRRSSCLNVSFIVDCC